MKDYSFKTSEISAKGFDIEYVSSDEKKVSIMKECDSSFNPPFFSLDSFEITLDKILKYADFIIIKKDTIYGYAAFYANDFDSCESYLTLIAVKKEFQNLGVGQLLISAVEDISYNRGMNCLKLEVDLANTNAIEFYKNNGYTQLDATQRKSIYMYKTLGS